MPSILRPVRAAIVVISFAISGNAFAQSDFFFPGADYDPAIPSFQDVLGYEPGERMTWHRDAIRYFEALEAAAPDRIRVETYAQSWEGRELVYAVVTSAENMARIDDVKAGMQRLRDPRRTSALAMQTRSSPISPR